MRRRCALGSMALALCACRGVSRRALIPVPPETAGGWVRRGLETLDVAGAPEPMRSLRPTAWVRAGYFRERISVQVEAFGFDSPAGALESAQKWHSYEGAVVRLRGQILLVYSSSNVDREDMLEFSRTLEAVWFGSVR
jgi:hypothetical protein